MTAKKLILIGILLLAGITSRAQVDLDAEFFSLPDEITGEYLDSVTVQKMSPNNYWAAGVFGGVTFNYGMFNPTRYTRWMVQYPAYGFSIIRHYTMFNMFPNMALEFGAQMGHEGYEFKINKETGLRTNVEPGTGAYKIYMKVPEVFFLTHFHGDHFGAYSKTLPLSDLSSTYRKQSLPEVLDLVPSVKLMDRGWPDYAYPFDMQTKASNSGAVSNYVKAVKWHIDNRGLVAERFKAGSRDQIVLKRKPSDYPGFIVQNIAVNGEIWDGGSTTTATATFPPLAEIRVADTKDVGNDDNCPEENHCTCVLKVSYGAFDFFEGGDAQYDGMSTFPWKDMETPVGLVTGPVDVMKADHHGVNNTNGYGYISKVTGMKAEAMKYLQPTCWIVNSWTDGHPREVEPMGTSPRSRGSTAISS